MSDPIPRGSIWTLILVDLFARIIVVLELPDEPDDSVKEIVEDFIKSELWNTRRLVDLDNEIKKVVTGEYSPYQIAEDLINNYKNSITE